MGSRIPLLGRESKAKVWKRDKSSKWGKFLAFVKTANPEEFLATEKTIHSARIVETSALSNIPRSGKSRRAGRGVLAARKRRGPKVKLSGRKTEEKVHPDL